MNNAMGAQNRRYKYEYFDGRVVEGLTLQDALDLEKADKEEQQKTKKTSKAQEVMAKLEQLSNSGNYTLEGALALAAKNQVSDDPNVQAYIKSMADSMINKSASKDFGFDQQASGNVPAQNRQSQPSGNTLSTLSNNETSSFDDTGKLENFFSGWNVQDGKSSYTNPAPSASPASGSGNTVLSAFQGGSQQPTMPQQGQERQNDFITRLPGELQQYIKRTGLSVADYETPVREYLVKRDAAGFYKSIANLVEAKRKADQALENNDRERAFGLTKDLYGKAPMSGPDGSESFNADDITKGKVSFGTERLESPVSRSEHKSYSYSSGGGGGQTNENLVKLQEARTNLIKVLNESGLDNVTKSNMLNGIDSQIEQEAKRSGYMAPAKVSENEIKQLNDAKAWLDQQDSLKENKRDARYNQVKSAYEAMKQKYGIRF